MINGRQDRYIILCNVFVNRRQILQDICVRARRLRDINVIAYVMDVEANIDRLEACNDRYLDRFLSRFQFLRFTTLCLDLFCFIALYMMFRRFDRTIVRFDNVDLAAQRVRFRIFIIVSELLRVADRFPYFEVVNNEEVYRDEFSSLYYLRKVTLNEFDLLCRTFLDEGDAYNGRRDN